MKADELKIALVDFVEQVHCEAIHSRSDNIFAVYFNNEGGEVFWEKFPKDVTARNIQDRDILVYEEQGVLDPLDWCADKDKVKFISELNMSEQEYQALEKFKESKENLSDAEIVDFIRKNLPDVYSYAQEEFVDTHDTFNAELMFEKFMFEKHKTDITLDKFIEDLPHYGAECMAETFDLSKLQKIAPNVMNEYISNELFERCDTIAFDYLDERSASNSINHYHEAEIDGNEVDVVMSIVAECSRDKSQSLSYNFTIIDRDEFESKEIQKIFDAKVKEKPMERD